jgi:hypothetical protein
MIAVAHDGERDIRRVGASDIGLGHGECGAYVAGQQTRQPGRLLFRCGEVQQHFHIAGIGRTAIEHFGREQTAAGELGDRRVIQIAQSCAETCVGQK